MVSAFPLAPTIAQTKIFCHILQRHIGSLHMNSMHPSNTHKLQVLIEIMMCFYVGKLKRSMVGGRDESPLLSNTMAEHSTVLACAANKIKLCSK